MYFEIENTPENLKKARKKEIIEDVPIEERPRLILAPFSRTPQMIFDNVLIGTTCKKQLEVLNPLKHPQQITLGKSLPPGLSILLPGDYLAVEPETCYCLTMVWTPTQLTTLRETIRFTNDNRGRYDVIVVLKSVMNVKGKSKLKTSPGKIKKKSVKRSPVSINKKKVEAFCNNTTVKTIANIVQSTQYKVVKPTNKENVHYHNDYSIDSNYPKCPFDSPSSLDFNPSEIFSSVLSQKRDIAHDTYDKSYRTISDNQKPSPQPQPRNVLKPSNKQEYVPSAADIFDNFTFTPLRSVPSRTDKLDKDLKVLGPISDSDLNDSLEIKNDKENAKIYVTSPQQSSKWLSNHTTNNVHYAETPTVTVKKIPDTSSPKDVNSPNFSINTDFSRISDLSFFPQKFSTERKMLPKTNNETYEIDDNPHMNAKLNSDTYTKESPITPFDYHTNQIHTDARHLPPFMKEQHPRMCRQALFKEQHHRDFNEINYMALPELYPWHTVARTDIRSPPRSLTPPMQSIPEESVQFSETQELDIDKTSTSIVNFTINRTFDKPSVNRQSSWSKTAVRAEPALWKTPFPILKKCTKPKMSVKAKEPRSDKSNQTMETNKSINQSSYINYVENVYSQSSTVDPFLSSTYFYDRDAVANFEKEFKRWLNCILTPPADLDSNIEQKVDLGKAWIENRNKEVPLAPTKEQVCSAYHNSHRLERLRRSARALLRSPEVSQVFNKLNAQVEKKLITIRNDRNLHLDVGLQKIIMEILLSYNPLWLRIGLEAIYGQILPLKSNNDIEGLTSFVIQRMFKNPNLKNKNSKSSAPNMLLPAYMEAIKKFTVKKFFILVFFLDQAKQKKLIPHDPCLFRRNAIIKESKEIVIRFTRELIAGIGDITKHLRPLGYVVCQKQSYLDEYAYAVHNVAVDMRDGVRLTKVMEIILMRNGLLHQLRTPAISRLQKIHNVQVALTALKEANFVIVGDISASDIADGHREKTLSLLWQLIHVFRAPLYEKAANVIQMWWRKKYQVIVEKRHKEHMLLTKRNNAASIIQYWWQRVQYNRMVDYQMRKATTATTVIQKYCRMWLCRNRLRKLKLSVRKISDWYRNMKKMQQARETLQILRLRREGVRNKSATLIQAQFRRWSCVKRYRNIKIKIVLIQSAVRRHLTQVRYSRLRKSVICVQRKYRGKLLMRKEMQNFAEKKRCIICIQSYLKMRIQLKYYKELKKSVRTIEKYYTSLILMRNDRAYYLKLKNAVLTVEAAYRRKMLRTQYLRQRSLVIKLQRKIRANQSMKKDRTKYLKLRNATIVIQNRIKSYQAMTFARRNYIRQRNAAILIQRYYRAYLQKKAQRSSYILLRKCVMQVQSRYRSIVAMRCQMNAYLRLRKSVLLIQRQYRALILMRETKTKYQALKKAALVLQRRYRASREMRMGRQKYMKLKSSCTTIQNAYRAYLKGVQQRQIYLKQKESAIKIQNWYRSLKKGTEIKQKYVQIKKACTVIQKTYRACIIGKKLRRDYIKIKTATICIQTYYRNYLLTKTIRNNYLEIRKSTIIIQQRYRTWLEAKNQRQSYLRIRQASVLIQLYYRQYRLTKMIRQEYCKLKQATICIQQRYRGTVAMRKYRAHYLTNRQSAIILQRRFRALQSMRVQRREYLKQRSAIITLQRYYKGRFLMKGERETYLKSLRACETIQIYYRAYKEGADQRKKYLQLKSATVCLQQRFKSIMLMRQERQTYLKIRSATLALQRRFRAQQMMLQERSLFRKIVSSCIVVQRFYRARLIGLKQKQRYITMRSAAIVIQTRYREFRKAQSVRNYYVRLRNMTVFIQRHIRARNVARVIAKTVAVGKIQTWYISIKRRNECRSEFIEIKRKVVTLQSIFRTLICRKRYLSMRNAAMAVQRYYRNSKISKAERDKYTRLRASVIKLQSHVRSFIARRRFERLRATVLTIQAVYKFKQYRALLRRRRQESALCIQKNVRRYLAQSRYNRFREKLIFVQKLWRSKLITRLIRCEFMQKRRIILQLQAAMRGYLVRKEIAHKKEILIKLKKEQRENWAASKIQALFRGHKTRTASSTRATELRRRWRNGGLISTQESLEDRNEDALQVLRCMSDIESIIRAFKSLELLSEVFPMLYNSNASSVVRKVYKYISLMNRSISSVEVLKSGASVLVNLTRYKVTGPKIYARDRITPALKLMWRFSNTETQLFCVLSTYVWLFSKYDEVKEDLTQFLLLPENHKMLVTIRGNVTRMKKMANNTRNKIFNTPQPSKNNNKIMPHTMNQSLRDNMNLSICSNYSFVLPALDPDYGITRADKPRYFEDAQQAINCLFETLYNDI